MKKLFSKQFLLTVVLAVFAVVSASAYDFEVGGIYYNILSEEDKTCEVTYGENPYSGDIVIPSSVTCYGNTYSVKEIGENAFNFCKQLTSIEIPSSVTEIGYQAFSGCNELKSVYISDLAAWCRIDFYNGIISGSNPLCQGANLYLNKELVENLVIPDSITEIKAYAFTGCKSLTSVVIPNSVTKIGENAFSGTGLTSVEIPNSVTKIGEYTFSKCSSLTSIGIPNSVMEIGSCAFSDCPSLTSVNIPNSVTKIGGHAFRGCTSLTSVEIPNSVTEIGNNPFDHCSSLEKFTGKFASDNGRCLIVDGVLNSFAPAGLTSYSIPNSITEIGEYAFNNCSVLTSVEIPNSVTKIGVWAFHGCTGLTSVVIPNSVTEIDNGAFNDCKGLTSVEIPNSVIKIIDNAFFSCEQLTSVVLPNSVTEIGNFAFGYCYGLTEITSLAVTPPTIYGYTFEGISMTDCMLKVPEDAMEAYMTAEHWNKFQTITGIYDVAFNILSEEDKTCEIKSGGNYSGDIVIPSTIIINGETYTVTQIRSGAFYKCSGLTSVVIPNSVTEIGSSAFSGCEGLTSVVIPNSVTTIGTFAFEKCTGLKSVTVQNEDPANIMLKGRSTPFRNVPTSTCILYVPKGSKELYAAAKWWQDFVNIEEYDDNFEVDNIEYGNISEDDNTCEVTGDNNDYSGDVVIPSTVTYNGETYTVTKIGAHAFEDCTDLTSVEIPSTVTEIGGYAFANCTGLKEIISLAVTPPSISLYTRSSSVSAFDGVSKTECVVKVPAESVDAYKAAEGWNEFQNIVALNDPTAITSPFSAASQQGKTYNLNGQEVQDDYKRIVIRNGKKMIKK